MIIIQKFRNLEKTYSKQIEKIQLTIFYLISIVLLTTTVREQAKKNLIS